MRGKCGERGMRGMRGMRGKCGERFNAGNAGSRHKFKLQQGSCSLPVGSTVFERLVNITRKNLSFNKFMQKIINIYSFLDSFV
jgi:hypothetical protein